MRDATQGRIPVGQCALHARKGEAGRAVTTRHDDLRVSAERLRSAHPRPGHPPVPFRRVLLCYPGRGSMRPRRRPACICPSRHPTTWTTSTSGCASHTETRRLPDWTRPKQDPDWRQTPPSSRGSASSRAQSATR